MDKCIFYVEDDKVLSFLTKDQLEAKGYRVLHFTNGESALDALGKEHFDLALLDIMLPGVDGFEIAKSLRQLDQAIPILFLSAKTLKEDRLKGFEIGADDYIVKPFSMEELQYKIEVFMRRRFIDQPSQQEVFDFGASSLDVMEQQLSIKGQPDVSLTYREVQILRLFAQNKNQVVKRELILEKIWGKNDYFHGRSLDVFVSRIRKYLKLDDRIELKNVHGVGFVLLEKK